MIVVVKLGGSLINSAQDIVNSLHKYAEATESQNSILIVPGGGIFADSIRSAGKQYDIGEVAAHWMAILAMEQYGYYLIDKTGVGGVDSINDLPDGVSILLPYRLLKETDELAHSWNVTSDTIAAWVASMIGVEVDARFVKVTDVDGVLVDNTLVQEIGATDLFDMGTTCVDIGLPEFIRANNMDCVVVNGHYPDRVIAAVEGEAVIGTYIKGNI